MLHRRYKLTVAGEQACAKYVQSVDHHIKSAESAGFEREHGRFEPDIWRFEPEIGDGDRDSSSNHLTCILYSFSPESQSILPFR